VLVTGSALGLEPGSAWGPEPGTGTGLGPATCQDREWGTEPAPGTVQGRGTAMGPGLGAWGSVLGSEPAQAADKGQVQGPVAVRGGMGSASGLDRNQATTGDSQDPALRGDTDMSARRGVRLAAATYTKSVVLSRE
jgi:hypothetical protein